MCMNQMCAGCVHCVHDVCMACRMCMELSMLVAVLADNLSFVFPSAMSSDDEDALLKAVVRSAEVACGVARKQNYK